MVKSDNTNKVTALGSVIRIEMNNFQRLINIHHKKQEIPIYIPIQLHRHLFHELTHTYIVILFE